MAIYYNIVTEERYRFPMSYMCFGLLNQVSKDNLRGCLLRNDKFSSSLATSLLERDSSYELIPNKIEYIEFRYCESLSSGMHQRFIDWVLEIQEAFDWMKGSFVIHPRLGIVRFNTNCPADKLMFMMSAIRNKCSVFSRYESGHHPDFPVEITSHECPRVRFVGLAYFYMSSYYDPITGEDGYMAYPRYSDESNIFNAQTFGKNSLRRFVQGIEPEWQQGNFRFSEKGYLRDSHFNFNRELWNEDQFTLSEVGSIRDVSYNDVIDDYDSDTYSYPYLNYNRLSNGPSIKGDEPIFESMGYNKYVGFYYPRDRSILAGYAEEFIRVATSE